MSKLLVIVRHGEYSGGDSSPLSVDGRKQIEGLRKVVNDFVAKTFGEVETTKICFSFSGFPRAIESIQGLRSCGEDIVVTNLYMTDRSDIREPQKILEKVMGVATHYAADVIIIVAHGEMPAVVAETAHEFVTGKKLGNDLPYVGKGRGFIVNMVTGEVTPIGYDSLEAKKPPQPKTRHIPEFVPPPIKPTRQKFQDMDDDIPF